MICPNINGQQSSSSVSTSQRQPATCQAQTQDISNSQANNSFHKVVNSAQADGQTKGSKTALSVQTGYSTMLQTAQIQVRGPDGLSHKVGVIFDSAM